MLLKILLKRTWIMIFIFRRAGHFRILTFHFMKKIWLNDELPIEWINKYFGGRWVNSIEFVNYLRKNKNRNSSIESLKSITSKMIKCGINFYSLVDKLPLNDNIANIISEHMYLERSSIASKGSKSTVASLSVMDVHWYALLHNDFLDTFSKSFGINILPRNCM